MKSFTLGLFGSGLLEDIAVAASEAFYIDGIAPEHCALIVRQPLDVFGRTVSVAFLCRTGGVIHSDFVDVDVACPEAEILARMRDAGQTLRRLLQKTVDVARVHHHVNDDFQGVFRVDHALNPIPGYVIY